MGTKDGGLVRRTRDGMTGTGKVGGIETWSGDIGQGTQERDERRGIG
jgi:hypothetical protein